MSEQDQPAPKKRGGKPFVKGDKRINRKGRPKSFDALRAEAVKIAGEIITSSDGSTAASRIHLMLLDWATSKDPRKQALFMSYAYGNVPNKNEITGAEGKELTIRYVNDWRNPTAITTHGTNSGDADSTQV